MGLERDGRPPRHGDLTRRPLGALLCLGAMAACSSASVARPERDRVAAADAVRPAEPPRSADAIDVSGELTRSVGVAATASSFATSDIPWTAEQVVNRQADRGWCEGVPGPGVGESVTLTLSRPMKVSRVSVVLLDRPDSLGSPHETPTALDVLVDGRLAARLTTPRTSDPTSRTREIETSLSGEPITEVTLRIAEVDRPRFEDTCVSETSLYGPGWPVVLWSGLGEPERAEVARVMLAARDAFARCDADALGRVLARGLSVRIARPGTRRADFHDDVDAATAADLCRAGRLTMPAWTGPLEAEEYTGAYVAFRFRERHQPTRSRWTVRRQDGDWRIDFADIRNQ